MDIYDSEYYKINKKLVMCYGIWPYDSYKKKFIIRVSVIVIMLSSLIPQIIGFFMNLGINIDKVIDHAVKSFYVFAISTKFTATFLSEKKLKIVYENIKNNWKVIKDDCERQIMVEFLERGRLLTLIYLVMVNVTAITFCTFPLASPLLDIILPLNESREQIFVLNGEYLIDKNKHFIEIYFLESLFCLMCGGLATALDTMYVANIEHCVGLFAIIKFRLRHSIKYISKNTAYKKIKEQDASYIHIVDTIELHKKVMRFIDILELSYSSSFLFLMGLNMLIISMGSIMVIVQLHHTLECIRYLLIAISMAIHLFYLSWPGQKIITSSTNLIEDAFLSDWYKFSLKAQKLIVFMILRCLKPCQLTAGGLYIMNFPNFATIIKSSLSYMTILASFR